MSFPHWPLVEETNEALRSCVSSFPSECEWIVVVNEGTGYGHNVNIGLRLASGDYIAVVNNARNQCPQGAEWCGD